MSRDWVLYLDDLIDSAEKVQRFLRGRSYEEFAAGARGVQAEAPSVAEVIVS